MSPDGAVEFYVFSPQWSGKSSWTNAQPSEKLASERRKTLTNKDHVVIRTYSSPDHTRVYEEFTSLAGTVRWGFGMKFRDQAGWTNYSSAFEVFKASCEQFAD